MSQILAVAHSAAHVVAAKLPAPKSKVTVPVMVVFALLAVIAIVRKIIVLAVVGVIVVALFAAYQSGAFNSWVDKGKQVIQQR
jgi:hypothetical protein